jgi:hypothetical protein
MMRIDGSFFCRLGLHRSSVDLEEGVTYGPNPLRSEILEMLRGTLFFFFGDAPETTGPQGITDIGEHTG